MAIPKIHDFKCRYHRNGVGGAGFFLCSFAIGAGKKTEYLRAVVFDCDRAESVAVFSQDIGECFRGADVYGPQLRALIDDAREDNSAFSRAAS